MLDIKKIKSKVDKFDVISVLKKINTVSFENNKLKTIDYNEVNGFGLRVINNNKIGFASSSDISAVDDTVSSAVDNAVFGEKSFFEPASDDFSLPELNVFSNSLSKLTSRDLLDTANSSLSRISKKITDAFINVEIEKVENERNFFNSYDLGFSERKTLNSFSVSLFKAENNNFLEIYDYVTDTDIIRNDLIEKIENNILFLYENSKQSVNVKTDYYPVYFTPKAFKYIVSFLLESFNGKLIQKKISLFSDKIGVKFFKKDFSIYDDPFLLKGTHSIGFDGDGIKPEKLNLINKGVIESYVLDLQTAGKLNVQGNGHAGRTSNSLPAPAFTNVVFLYDSVASETDIIESIDKGIIIDQLLGAGQSNIIGGEFSANIDLGFYVENGKITGRIKDAMVSGNLFEFLNNIVKVSDNVRTYGHITSPGVLIDRMSIAGK